jgi:phosphate:Na+ symporter
MASVQHLGTRDVGGRQFPRSEGHFFVHSSSRRPRIRVPASCVVLVLPILLASLVLPATGQTSSQLTAPQVDRGTDPTSRISLRLIPDQRARLGSPATTIDLEPLFRESILGESGTAITAEILSAKKDVALASLDGLVLTLDWQTKTGKKRDILIRASDATGEHVDTKFSVELWEPDYWQLLLTVIGGLGLFLLGMKNMSNGLQAIAGQGLRRMISWVTDNRLMAVGVGTLITMLVQSSSITTVMVVGFVNSGFMTLQQAIGVIMGANIGTTITGWILVLKIGKYGLPIAGAAAFFYLFARRDRVRYVAMAIMGLGLIFFGLELMKDGFAFMKDLPEFEAWFKRFSADSYFGVLKCAAVGCILTFIVQSSSATLGITIGLAQLGVIEFETAAALVLGENIGTTITAWLASFGTTTNAKRSAWFHIIFNLAGVAWITAVFPFYMTLIRFFTLGETGTPLTLEGTSAATITAAIAATHTGFNVTNTIVFLPLTGYLARFLQRVLPERSMAEERPRLTNLDVRMLESPAIAIEQSRREVVQMAKNCQAMMDVLRPIEETGTWTENQASQLLEMEEHQDEMQVEFVQFMSNLLVDNVPHAVIDEARHQIRLVDEYESVSDCIASAFKSKRRLKKRDKTLPDRERQEILQLHDEVASFLRTINQAFIEENPDLLSDGLATGEAITKHAKRLARQMVLRPAEEQLDPFTSTSYSRQVAAYRRVRDHLINILEVVKGEK